MRKISVPCYIKNGGHMHIINVPMGVFVRLRLKRLCDELLARAAVLQTFVAAEATPATLELLRGLSKILSLNLKPKKSREAANTLLADNEINLSKKVSLSANEEEEINLVSFAISCGLIAILFLLGAHLNYLESLN